MFASFPIRTINSSKEKENTIPTATLLNRNCIVAFIKLTCERVYNVHSCNHCMHSRSNFHQNLCSNVHVVVYCLTSHIIIRIESLLESVSIFLILTIRTMEFCNSISFITLKVWQVYAELPCGKCSDFCF